MDVRSLGAAVIREFVFVTSQPGIATRHVFSAGPHYDPSNLSFGPVIGCDEHTVDVGAGFDDHAHRGVVIVSWVLAGTLRHVDGDRSIDVVPGDVLVQATGDGVRHTEFNGGDDTLVFVQTTLLADTEASVTLTSPPASLPGGAQVRLGEPGPDDFAVHAGDDVLVIAVSGTRQ